MEREIYRDGEREMERERDRQRETERERDRERGGRRRSSRLLPTSRSVRGVCERVLSPR